MGPESGAQDDHEIPKRRVVVQALQILICTLDPELQLLLIFVLNA